jgi:D-sedoheptulose 7-phosphate isomerase
MDFIEHYVNNLNQINEKLDIKKIKKIVDVLVHLKKNNGRLFILGVGGSAGNTSHAVNDFRKLCEIETYSPTDNVSEITARTNDEGFDTVFFEYLKVSQLSKKDILLIFSVGGGSLTKKISLAIIKAIKYAKKQKSKVISILGKKDGYAALNSTISIVVDPLDKKLLTPISESYQGVIWHLLVSHPLLQKNKTKW